MSPPPDRPVSGPTVDLDALAAVHRRVLWLATAIVHHANHLRPNDSGVKVGGHQASSASMTGIMTALYFADLGPGDLVSVKPHAAPVLHAINYLLGRLDASYLPRLRDFGGLQAYPSRTKDPDPVDFSTGSVGIGATAPIWAALARRYLRGHASTGTAAAGGRHISLLGDAELDEGAVWEAVVDPTVAALGEVLWVVDLNRQSLDRVVPTIAAPRLEAMFAGAGWQVLTLKYGRRLRALFDQPGGAVLRGRIDTMGNPEYQRLLRSSPDQLRDRLAGSGEGAGEIRRLVEEVDDDALRAAVRDLGGHDLADLLDAFARVDPDRPSVILAYTVKGRGLPTEGHPANHSALLRPDQLAQLAAELGADEADPWALPAAGSPAAELCAAAAARLARPPVVLTAPPPVPADLGRGHGGVLSTQAALGRVLLDLSRQAPEVAARVVTVSPDVASSTNLGGWINKVGVFTETERTDWFGDDPESVLHWREHARGQHLELGIAEVNLVGLLGELGATWSRWGEPLLPVGTLYDPFLNRALEPWSYGIYAGGQSILVGTPSGITLAAEGGAHQSVVTPSVVLEQPGVVGWEPAFTQDLEWCFLAALGRLGRADGTSAYFRLTTRPLDQSLAAVPPAGPLREARRADVLAGGYLLSAPAGDAPVELTLVGMGAVMPEVIRAGAALAGLGVACSVVCVTSADLLHRAARSRRGLPVGGSADGATGAGADGGAGLLDRLLVAGVPLVTVLDGHPHTLEFLAGVHGVALTGLGVTGFGQSGSVEQLYRANGLDADTIVGAGLDLLDR